MERPPSAVLSQPRAAGPHSKRRGSIYARRRSPAGREPFREVDRPYVHAGPEPVKHGRHAEVPARDERVHGQPRCRDPFATDRGKAGNALAKIGRVAIIKGPFLAVGPPAPSAEFKVQGQNLGFHLVVLAQPEAGAKRREHVALIAVDRPVGKAIAFPLAVRIRPHTTEVEKTEPAVGTKQVVPRVRVGVKQTAREVQAAPRPEEQAAKVIPQFLVRIAGQEGVDVNAVDILHREHSSRAVFTVHAGDDDLVVLLKKRAGAALPFGLALVVGLLLDDAANILELILQRLPTPTEA